MAMSVASATSSDDIPFSEMSRRRRGDVGGGTKFEMEDGLVDNIWSTDEEEGILGDFDVKDECVEMAMPVETDNTTFTPIKDRKNDFITRVVMEEKPKQDFITPVKLEKPAKQDVTPTTKSLRRSSMGWYSNELIRICQPFRSALGRPKRAISWISSCCGLEPSQFLWETP